MRAGEESRGGWTRVVRAEGEVLESGSGAASSRAPVCACWGICTLRQCACAYTCTHTHTHAHTECTSVWCACVFCMAVWPEGVEGPAGVWLVEVAAFCCLGEGQRPFQGSVHRRGGLSTPSQGGTLNPLSRGNSQPPLKGELSTPSQGGTLNPLSRGNSKPPLKGEL